MFVYADLVGDKPYRRNQTGMLIFINKAPICCYSKSQATVEASSLVSEVCAMNAGVDIVEDLHYNLQMFVVPINVSANEFCDNDDVFKNTITPEFVLKNNNHSIAYHMCREAVDAKTIRFAKNGTNKNPYDLFTKNMTESRRRLLLEKFSLEHKIRNIIHLTFLFYNKNEHNY